MTTYDNNLFVGKVLITLEAVDSTNVYAKNLVSKSKPLEGTAIIAHAQLKGKGQIGNKWFSEPGKNLTFSIVLYPNFLKASIQFGLTQSIALGICDVLQPLLNNMVMIKWPNDIYCDGKKLAGILIENSISGLTLADSIVGIGLNVNQTNFEGVANATSLSLLTEKQFELATIRDSLFQHVEARYLQLKNGHTRILEKDYLTRLFRRNEWHEYKTANGIIKGKIKGVSLHGKLELETEKGIEYFNNKEIGFI